jgi:hypothetical protein
MVSYARLDGRELAAKLRTEITKVLGVAPWQDVLDMEGGEEWWRQIEDQIRRSVGLVLALTPAALTSEVVRREWVCARRNGKPIYPVVADQLTLGPEAPRWLRMVDVFLLDEAHPDVVQARRRFHEQLREPPDIRPVPFMPGALPAHHVSRLAERASLLDAFVAPSNGDPIFSDVVLQGAPGFGKTTLAQELCHEPSVVNAFSGGVLWATLGEHGQGVLPGLRAMVSALAGRPANFATAQDGAKELEDLLIYRDCLMVVDDVWDLGHLQPFLGARCARLITTRNGQELSFASAQLRSLAEMTTEEAVEMLARYARVGAKSATPSAGELAALGQLATRLGEWPLLLTIFGGALRAELARGQTLEAALKRIDLELGDVGLTVFDRGDSRERALAASMQASLGRFTPSERERLYELSIFEEDDAIDEAVALRLWAASAGLKGAEGRRLLREWGGMFFGFGTEGGETRYVLRFHDAIREYLAGRLAPDRRRELHQLLLASYAVGRPWSEVKDDGYLFDHLAYHLIEAGNADALHRLFDDQRWMEARFAQCDFTYDGGLKDLSLAMAAAAAPVDEAELDDDAWSRAITLCARLRLIASSVVSLAAGFPASLVCRAVAVGLWPELRAIRLFTSIPGAHDQLDAWATLLSLDGLSEAGRTMAEELAFNVIAALAPDGRRAFDWQADPKPFVLIRVAAAMRGPRRGQVLQRAITFATGHAERSRARSEAGRALGRLECYSLPKEVAHAFAAIARQLPADAGCELARRGIGYLGGIDDSKERVHAIAALLPSAPDDLKSELRAEAETAIEAITNDQERLFALSALANALGEEGEPFADRVWTASLAIEDEPWRAFCLSRLAPRLAGARRLEALALARRTAGTERGWALVEGLLSTLTRQERDDLATVMRAHPDSEGRTWGWLAQLGVPLQSTEVVALMRHLRSRLTKGYGAGWLLTPVVAGLDQNRVAEALDILSLSTKAGADALRPLTSRPSGPPRPAVAMRPAPGPLVVAGEAAPASEPEIDAELERIAGIEREPAWRADREKSDALYRYLPLLSPRQLNRVRAIARDMSRGWERALTLIGVAARMEGDGQQQVLEETLTALAEPGPNDDRRAAIVERIAPLAGASVMRHTMDAALQYEEWSRIRALKALLPFTSGQLLDDAVAAIAAFANDSSKRELLQCAPSMPDATARIAVDLVAKMGDRSEKTGALVLLAARVPKQLLGALFDQASGLEPHQRARLEATILAIAPETPDLKECLKRDIVHFLRDGNGVTRDEVLRFLGDPLIWWPPLFDPSLLLEISTWAERICAWKWV